MSTVLRSIVAQNRSGQAVAIPSVCSAHNDVLIASLLMAKELERPIVIEATSNQVNQDGGYTGLTPRDFIINVRSMCEENGVPQELVVFGGDHLGPQAWRALEATAAMDKAVVMIADYVKAGFAKIHLDCSEGCLGEAAQLPDEVTANRSALLAKVALDAADDPSQISFVIGTEVPPPGGARVDEAGDIPATTLESAKATVKAHVKAFQSLGIGWALDQVLGLVVQPGVEFSPTQVHHFPMNRALDLRSVLNDLPNLTLEAHSTDYQHETVFPSLAELGFGFQKVGPALTHAWRRGVYALDIIQSVRQGTAPKVRNTMTELMHANPKYWMGHYDDQDPRLDALLHYGLADRIRYYWADTGATDAVDQLFRSFGEQALDPLEAGEFFSGPVLKRAWGLGGLTARNLVLAEVQEALAPYLWSENAKRGAS